MIWKDFVADYLTFSKKERIAAFCVLLIVAALYWLPKTFPKNEEVANLSTDTSLLNALAEKRTIAQKDDEVFENVSNPFYEKTVPSGFTEGALFYFDPNTLTADGWQKLGLPNRTLKTLINYRNKGGRFYKKEDLKKIWGLPEAFYARVEPYIEIQSSQQNNIKFENSPSYNNKPSKGFRNISVVQVNTADTSALIALPGIGSKLATRILNFRDKLGGFYSSDQIGEIYGLSDSTFQILKPYLQVDANVVNKLNLNTATKDELKMHPYIKWALANAIVEYRNQHGTFKDLEELKNIMLIDEATYKKIVPYFSL